MKGGLLVDNKFINGQDQNLTVRKTSLFFAGDGFTVYDCKGTLVFRVDSYGGPNNRDTDEVVLMNAHGRCLLTLRRKRPSLRRRWEGYLGERTDGQKPIFGVRRSSMIGRNSVTVEVYECNEYLIEGNFGQRSCTVVEAETRRKVAEIRRKVDASTNVMLGKDVFSLNVKAGFDGAFAVGLVLVLDQIYGDDYVEVGEEQVHPYAEDR
ncbi:Protein LURP-one-related 5 [Raphanus sativus]|uniref:Protein LURP-one-related 5 n=1 Tax=Raphanus sativus TaxID=3726 RepID=A0A6J0LRC5_RAPSA|nr:protein LURP-one-related 5 [Raphanus sativus]KAJ4874325.1 Protein LURP-one-related 5 [Raphanus sativus]